MGIPTRRAWVTGQGRGYRSHIEIAEYTEYLERYGITPRREERDWIIELGRAAKEGDKWAREELIRSGMHLVVWRARAHWCQNKEDLIQWGNVGLVHAANKYDPDKFGEGNEVLFSTYALWWIDQCIDRFCDDSHAIHVPGGQRQWMHKFKAYSAQFWAETGRMPDIAELRERFNLPEKKAARIYAGLMAAHVQSMFAMSKGTARHFVNRQSTQRYALDFLVQRAEDIQRVRDALDKLPEKRDAYYLLQRAAGRTLEDLGTETGVTRERIRQVSERALQRLATTLNSVPCMTLTQAIQECAGESGGCNTPDGGALRKASGMYGMTTQEILDLLGHDPQQHNRERSARARERKARERRGKQPVGRPRKEKVKKPIGRPRKTKAEKAATAKKAAQAKKLKREAAKKHTIPTLTPRQIERVLALAAKGFGVRDIHIATRLNRTAIQTAIRPRKIVDLPDDIIEQLALEAAWL